MLFFKKRNGQLPSRIGTKLSEYKPTSYAWGIIQFAMIGI